MLVTKLRLLRGTWRHVRRNAKWTTRLKDSLPIYVVLPAADVWTTLDNPIYFYGYATTVATITLLLLHVSSTGVYVKQLARPGPGDWPLLRQKKGRKRYTFIFRVALSWRVLRTASLPPQPLPTIDTCKANWSALPLYYNNVIYYILNFFSRVPARKTVEHYKATGRYTYHVWKHVNGRILSGFVLIITILYANIVVKLIKKKKNAFKIEMYSTILHNVVYDNIIFDWDYAIRILFWCHRLTSVV